MQEYFYDDYAKINAVLNDNKMLKPQKQKDLDISLKDDFLDSEKVVYEVTESSEWDISKFKTICKNNAKQENTDSANSHQAESADEPSAE